MSASPSVSYSITVRLEAPAYGNAVSRLTRAVEDAGGVVTGLDVPASGHERLRIDVTIAASSSAEHAERDRRASCADIEGVEVGKVSDRTFLMHLGGKIEMQSKVPIRNRDDLSMAYTPGVARVCMAHRREPRGRPAADHQAQHRRRGHRRLGGAGAGQHRADRRAAGDGGQGGAVQAVRRRSTPGRCAWTPRTPRRSSRSVKAIAPGFAGINLEDISAPRCFEIERRLREELDIPVFHDDQHGTAIVVLAALTNALRVVGQEACGDVRIVGSGAGAAGTAILKLLIAAGAKDITVADYPRRRARAAATTPASRLATCAGSPSNTNPARPHGHPARRRWPGRTSSSACPRRRILTGDDIATMAPGAIVFALANPEPEVDPATRWRHAAVVATGRSDFPNQINNVLAFPGVFRGLIDAQSEQRHAGGAGGRGAGDRLDGAGHGPEPELHRAQRVPQGSGQDGRGGRGGGGEGPTAGAWRGRRRGTCVPVAGRGCRSSVRPWVLRRNRPAARRGALRRCRCRAW